MLTARPAGVLSTGPRYRLRNWSRGKSVKRRRPDRDAGEIGGRVVMRGDAGAGADPDARERLAAAEIDVVRLVQALEEAFHVDRGEVDRRRVGPALHLIDLAEDLAKLRAQRAEVHRQRAAGGLVIEQAAAVGGRHPHRDGEGQVARVRQEIGPRLPRRAQARRNQRPVAHQPAHDERLGRAAKPARRARPRRRSSLRRSPAAPRRCRDRPQPPVTLAFLRAISLATFDSEASTMKIGRR